MLPKIRKPTTQLITSCHFSKHSNQDGAKCLANLATNSIVPPPSTRCKLSQASSTPWTWLDPTSLMSRARLKTHSGFLPNPASTTPRTTPTPESLKTSWTRFNLCQIWRLFLSGTKRHTNRHGGWLGKRSPKCQTWCSVQISLTVTMRTMPLFTCSMTLIWYMQEYLLVSLQTNKYKSTQTQFWVWMK